MMRPGITPEDMVIVDGIRCYPDPSATPAPERDDDKKDERPSVPKARVVQNKARRPADK